MLSRTYPDDEQAETVREGYAPDKVAPLQPHDPENIHNTDQPLREDSPEEARKNNAMWDTERYDDEGQEESNPKFGSFSEERDAWGR